MARDNWDDSDPDFAALAGRPRRKLKIAWTPLLAIVGLTFGAAYYIPLHRAHSSLTERHAAAAERSRKVDEELAKTQKELRTSEEQRRSLEVRVAEFDERAAQSSRRIESLKERLSSGLAKPVRSGAIRLESGASSVTLTIPSDQLFTPQRLDVSPKGKDLLCDVARAAGDGVLVVSASVSSSDVAPPAMRQVLKSPWSVAALRGTQLAETLEKSCRVPASRIQSAGAGAGQGSRAGQVRIEVLPPAS